MKRKPHVFTVACPLCGALPGKSCFPIGVGYIAHKQRYQVAGSPPLNKTEKAIRLNMGSKSAPSVDRPIYPGGVGRNGK